MSAVHRKRQVSTAFLKKLYGQETPTLYSLVEQSATTNDGFPL